MVRIGTATIGAAIRDPQLTDPRLAASMAGKPFREQVSAITVSRTLTALRCDPTMRRAPNLAG